VVHNWSHYPLENDKNELLQRGFHISCEEEIFAGYKYYVDNLVAIARLRGHTLKTLHIAAQDILYDVGEPSFDEELSLQFVSCTIRCFCCFFPLPLCN
jgi:hypothetical protein